MVTQSSQSSSLRYEKEKMILFRRYISKVVSQSVQLRLASNIGNRLPLYLLQYINKNSKLLDKISKIARQLP